MFTVQTLEPQRQQQTAARPPSGSSPLFSVEARLASLCVCDHTCVFVYVCVNGTSAHLKDPSATLRQADQQAAREAELRLPRGVNLLAFHLRSSGRALLWTHTNHVCALNFIVVMYDGTSHIT